MSSNDTSAFADTGSPARAGGDDPLVGTLIDGKYRVEKLIGQGGMGKVYRGRNIRTESPVAIKTLIQDLVRDDALIKRFEIEAKSASNLRHPNTIRIFDFGQEGDTLFMVMELLDGMSLEGLLRRDKRIEPARMLRIVRQACESLSEAHSTGLVHRDLKPDNIFLNRVGDHSGEEFVKVLDFGVAKLRDKRYGNATLTQAGMIFGTPRYMSPEQARAFDIDQRSDIYALGVIMYECCTGEIPFDGNDPVAILIQHVQEPPPPFRLRAPDLAPMPEVESVIMRCLCKKAEDRYGDVRELIGEIDRLLAGIASGSTSSMLAQPGGATVQLAPDVDRPKGVSARPKGVSELATQGFESLGVGVDPRRDPTYALGNATLGATGLQPSVRRSPLPLVVGGVVVVLLAAAAVILALVATSGAGREGAEASGAADVVAGSGVGSPTPSGQSPTPSGQSGAQMGAVSPTPSGQSPTPSGQSGAGSGSGAATAVGDADQAADAGLAEQAAPGSGTGRPEPSGEVVVPVQTPSGQSDSGASAGTNVDEQRDRGGVDASRPSGRDAGSAPRRDAGSGLADPYGNR